jgi:adenylosuccinate lyase
MSSSVFDMVLLKHLWSTDELRAIFCDETRVQRWFDYEAQLALAQAELGIVPQAAADDIAAHADICNVDLEAIAEGIRTTRHPLVPALRALQQSCRAEHGEWLHYGPTTQDVLDTGTVLQLRDAHAIFLRDLVAVGREVMRLADMHKATPMAGRTHAVQALPITFGHKCAVWLAELARHHQRLREVEKRLFVGSMVGAVGTQASFGPRAFETEALLMKRLGLARPEISWQPSRDRFTEYASVLGLIGATLGKIANEILTLSHNEIGELDEPSSDGKVGSSTMPHKRNPTVCENVLTVAASLRYNVAFIQEAMKQEHERDGAAWKVEWKALPEICLSLGAMLAQMKPLLSGLVVHADRMRANLDLLGGYLLSERVMFELSSKVGKQSAHELVREASMHGLDHGQTLEQALQSIPAVTGAMSRDELAAVLDPTTYVGMAPQIVERVLEETRRSGWLA